MEARGQGDAGQELVSDSRRDEPIDTRRAVVVTLRVISEPQILEKPSRLLFGNAESVTACRPDCVRFGSAVRWSVVENPPGLIQ
jgi:hypothetical protein